MSILSNSILAFSMSADAFAAAVSKGVSLRKPKLKDAMRIGMVFGLVETITPIIGWGIGVGASRFIESIDHWVAFILLSLIGGKLIYEGFSNEPSERKEYHRLGILILTAIGTSIDALAVGVMLALIDANIIITALMIGCATFMMATLGIMTGHYIGLKAGKIAEVLGGFCLIAIGCSILHQHLSVPL